MTSKSLLAGCLVALAACGGDDAPSVNHVATPAPAQGGGIHDGAIKGELNVFAVEEHTNLPLAGAAVRIEMASGDPITGTTSATGLFTATDDRLGGGADITVAASSYQTSSWLGANGAVVTIPLTPLVKPTVPTATASGTITGWDALPAPASGHVLLGVVGFSLSDDFASPGNDVKQPPSTGLAPNACYKTETLSPPCAWTLVTRTGDQAHYAVILDVDGHGTPSDASDDTYNLVGFGYLGSLSFNAGENHSGEALALTTDAPIAMTVTFPATPAGLTHLTALPLIHIDGQLIPVPGNALTPDSLAVSVPALLGPFAGAKYDLLVQGKGADDADVPQSLLLQHDVSLATTVAIEELFPLPGGLQASTGRFSFTAVPGATLQTASFEVDAGHKVWGIAIFDGRTSFALPTLASGGLPTGALEYHVSAISLPGIDLTNFDLEGYLKSLDKSSEGFITFTN